MAKAILSALGENGYVKFGYGQVEPNHLSAQRTHQIYAQLPAAEGIEVLENGQYAKYNYADGVVDFEGEGEWMLVYNEVKVYGDHEGDQDFALIKAKEGYGVNVQIVPRLFKTNIGDIYTTNTIKETTLAEGETLTPGTDGYLAKAGADAEGVMKWQVVKVYTLADGQPAVKLMRIA
jgi:hypothetical protein